MSRAASKAASKIGSRRGSVDAGTNGMGDDIAMQDFPTPSPSASFTSTAGRLRHGGIDGDVVLLRADPAKQEPLDSLVPLDPLAHEQSLIDDDEFADAQDDDGGDEDMHDDDGEEGEMGLAGRRQQRRRSVAAVSSSSKGGQIERQVSWDEAVPRDDDDEDDDDLGDDSNLMYNEEDEANTPGLLEKRKLERDEIEFPDEVDFPMDTIAKDRFQRYRGLKSFKNSPWDPKENLPLEYGQIYQFKNFEAVRNRIVKDAKKVEGVVEEEELAELEEAGCVTERNSVNTQRFYPVTIFLRDVPQAVATSIQQTLAPIVVFGLFKFEHKVSVLHFSVKRGHEYSLPIKSKEAMEFHVAFRRFVAQPIYSHESLAPSSMKQNEKNMTTRFFQQGSFVTASVYGRITFPPATVIMFKPQAQVAALVAQGKHATPTEESATALAKALMPQPLLTTTPSLSQASPIVASGSLVSVNPDRLLIKRIILTGTPISVHKRHAVVRHMFFNAADVRWFQPVELWTKYGLVGHIIESRGTKGYMKCQFDKFIKQNDTVCMSLYKRQFPPWNEQLFTATNL